MSTVCRDINELLPAAQTACKLFMAKCAEAGLNVFITETYRSQARQDELYEQGRTKLWDENGSPLKIVTWTKNSRHTSRRAWDIACNGKTLYDTGTLRKAGQIGKELGITWGGDWSTPDMPHFEISADWTEPKEAEEMTQEDFNKMMENYLAENGAREPSEWSAEARGWAEANGIIVGDENGDKRYKAPVTREELVSILMRMDK